MATTQILSGYVKSLNLTTGAGTITATPAYYPQSVEGNLISSLPVSATINATTGAFTITLLKGAIIRLVAKDSLGKNVFAQELTITYNDTLDIADYLNANPEVELITQYTLATTSAAAASASASEASGYVEDASGFANNASTSAIAASGFADDASASAGAALTSENNASTSETNAGTSEDNAATSETNASSSATLAQNWATQLTTEVVTGQGYSAKQYAANAAQSAVDALTAAGGGVLSLNTRTGNVTLTSTDVNLGNVTNDAQVKVSEKGVALGVVPLDADTKISSDYLPSYVDDVLEFANLAAFPASGISGKIYVALDTNKTYRWSGSVYIYITSGAVDTVFGRSGVVAAEGGDYTADLITETASRVFVTPTQVAAFHPVETATSIGTLYNAAAVTLTNKTINLTSNTLVTTLAQLNSAVSDADLCPVGGPGSSQAFAVGALSATSVVTTGDGRVGSATPIYNARFEVIKGAADAYVNVGDEFTAATANKNIALGAGGYRNVLTINALTGSVAATRSTTGLLLNSFYGSNAYAASSININCNTGVGTIHFYTGTGSSAIPTERAVISSTGLAVTGDVSATEIITASKGIAFPATQVASSNPNTLDDYEEGTFTPTIAGITSAGVGTYTTQIGTYTKVGNRVSITIYLIWSAHTGTGNMQISGLPFVSKTTTGYATFSLYVSNIALTAGHVVQTAMGDGSTNIPIYSYATGGGASTSVALDTAGTILLSGTYEV